MFATDKLWFSLDSALTFVKEGDVVILHRPKVEVLPEIRLLWGVRRQKTLSMESLLCAPGEERGIRTEALFNTQMRWHLVPTCSNQAVKPALRVPKVIYDQWICTAEQIQQQKEVLEAKRMKTQPMKNSVSLLKMHWFHQSLLNSAHLTNKSFKNIFEHF